MMFSSRRSRNRHSANPNPKLHLPQTVRRKLPDSAGGLGIPDSATGEYEDDDEGEGGSGTAVYPGSPMSLSSQYALRCAAAAAGSAVHRQIILDDDDDDDDVASNHSTAAESVSTVPEDTPANTITHTGSSDTALNLVCSPRSSTGLASAGNENGGPETGVAEQEPGVASVQMVTGSGGGSSGRSTSKRKSAVPTRCSTQQLQDDDLMSDDNSSDVPAAKRRNVELATSTDEASTSATEVQPDKPTTEPNNNKVRDQDSKSEEDRMTDGPDTECGTADPVVPRTSTPTTDDVQVGDIPVMKLIKVTV